MTYDGVVFQHVHPRVTRSAGTVCFAKQRDFLKAHITRKLRFSKEKVSSIIGLNDAIVFRTSLTSKKCVSGFSFKQKS